MQREIFAAISFCLVAAVAASGQEKPKPKEKLTAKQQCEAARIAAMIRIARTETEYRQIEPQIISLREVMELRCGDESPSVPVTLDEAGKKLLELQAQQSIGRQSFEKLRRDVSQLLRATEHARLLQEAEREADRRRAIAERAAAREQAERERAAIEIRQRTMTRLILGSSAGLAVLIIVVIASVTYQRSKKNRLPDVMPAIAKTETEKIETPKLGDRTPVNPKIEEVRALAAQRDVKMVAVIFEHGDFPGIPFDCFVEIREGTREIVHIPSIGKTVKWGRHFDAIKKISLPPPRRR